MHQVLGLHQILPASSLIFSRPPRLFKALTPLPLVLLFSHPFRYLSLHFPLCLPTFLVFLRHLRVTPFLLTSARSPPQPKSSITMPSLALKPGSLIFVTGVNGLIGSHVVDQLLLRGYNVREAVRDLEKPAWLQEYIRTKHSKATFELVAVPDMTSDGCYDDVVKGKFRLTFLHNTADKTKAPMALFTLHHPFMVKIHSLQFLSASRAV